MVVREQAIGEKDESETSFFTTSLAPKVRTLANPVRGHWGIENVQNCIRHVIFAEDPSRIRSGPTPEISASIFQMALNILQQDATTKDSNRICAGWDEAVLDGIWDRFFNEITCDCRGRETNSNDMTIPPLDRDGVPKQ
jgi:predicted transposase YbfD/YdcC